MVPSVYTADRFIPDSTPLTSESIYLTKLAIVKTSCAL
jgi:hypothetical protein